MLSAWQRIWARLSIDGGSLARIMRHLRCSGIEHLASAILPKCPSSLLSARDRLASFGRLVERAPLNSW